MLIFYVLRNLKFLKRYDWKRVSLFTVSWHTEHQIPQGSFFQEVIGNLVVLKEDYWRSMLVDCKQSLQSVYRRITRGLQSPESLRIYLTAANWKKSRAILLTIEQGRRLSSTMKRRHKVICICIEKVLGIEKYYGYETPGEIFGGRMGSG